MLAAGCRGVLLPRLDRRSAAPRDRKTSTVRDRMRRRSTGSVVIARAPIERLSKQDRGIRQRGRADAIG